MKAIVGAVWIACLVAFALPADTGWASAGRMLFFVLAIVHGIECVVFLPKLRAAGGSLAHHLVQTFLFGILHVRGLEARTA